MALAKKPLNFNDFVVLIVEDNERIMNLLVMILDELEISTVHKATNGHEGIEALKENPDINLVLSDWKMPGMDGMEFMKHAKMMVPNLPVIMITGQATPDVAIQASDQGAHAFLLKPFTPDKLDVLLSDLVKDNAKSEA